MYFKYILKNTNFLKYNVVENNYIIKKLTILVIKNIYRPNMVYIIL